MKRVYLSLGSNLGDRETYILKGIQEILNFSTLESLSSIWETSPWRETLGGDFLNCVINIKTNLSPVELLQRLLLIEHNFGRRRNAKHSPRQIDIDILFYEKVILTTPTLTIPHPYLHLRKFVLLPLKEVAPKLIHPVLHKNVTTLLRELKSKEKCKLYLKRESFSFKLKQCGV
jgi:2-amino-4-hydroxy-6-hydroxymethyldihydropteridine diphosphokinase